ncbi:MAG: hypothetical protein GY827_11500 [Cytophagales bacterium]|nr:hypothetical protein [Cytophagales bacterium]
MKKILFTLSLIFGFMYFVNAQCDDCAEYNRSTKIRKNRKTDLKKRYPKGYKKAKWRKCNSSEITFAYFTLGDTTYSVVYNTENKWIGTEKRIIKLQNRKKYNYKTKQTTTVQALTPSLDIYPKEVLKIMYDKDYNLRVSDNELCDYYIIILPDEHEFVKKYKTNTFYATSMDSVQLTWTSKEQVLNENNRSKLWYSHFYKKK